MNPGTIRIKNEILYTKTLKELKFWVTMALCKYLKWKLRTNTIQIQSEKSTFSTMQFSELMFNKYSLGLSNELLFVIIAPRAKKLRPVKVGEWIKIFVWAFPNPSSVSKSLDVLDFSSTCNFDRSQFCSPLSYDDEK